MMIEKIKELHINRSMTQKSIIQVGKFSKRLKKENDNLKKFVEE